MPRKPKQTHLNKEQVAQQVEREQLIARQKTLARQIFPAVEALETIYDGQTAFNAASGFIKLGITKREEALKVSDLEIDLSKEQDGPMKHAVQSIIELVHGESALDAMKLIELMGSKLPEFIWAKHMKEPMNTILANEYIAD